MWMKAKQNMAQLCEWTMCTLLWQELIPLQWERHRLLRPPVSAPWAVLVTPQEDTCQEEITQSSLQWKVSSRDPSDISKIHIQWLDFLIINVTSLHSEAQKLSWCLELFHHRFEFDVSLEEVKTRKLDVAVKNNKMFHTRERKDIGMVRLLIDWDFSFRAQGEKAMGGTNTQASTYPASVYYGSVLKNIVISHIYCKKQFIAHCGSHISAIVWITDWILKFCSCQQVMVDFSQLDLTRGITEWYEARFSAFPWFVWNGSCKLYFWVEQKSWDITVAIWFISGNKHFCMNTPLHQTLLKSWWCNIYWGLYQTNIVSYVWRARLVDTTLISLL